MNAERGNIDIHIPVKIETTTTIIPKETKNSVKIKASIWVKNVWKFYVDDINRLIFPFKVGLAVVIVSLLILISAPYHFFGDNNLIWAILTTAVMFEYTVGMTFSKGFNRAIGSSFAGILAIAIAQVALCTRTIAAPIIIGVSIFFIGTITSFMKIWPSLVQYEYAFRVTLFTFCLIIVSGYRMGHSITVAIDRLYSVAIGGIIAVLVNVLVFPTWAGEELHKELVVSFNMVADALEECVIKYIEFDGSDESSRTVIDEFSDQPAYKRCRNSLVASNKLQTLANSAKWEPPHGRFKQFSYPWSQYVTIGTILRYCAYDIMALHGVLHSEYQAPYNLRVMFKQEIQELTGQATKLLRGLGKDISNMKRSLQTSTPLIKQLHGSTYQLQRAINQHLYLNTKPNILEDSNAALSLATFISLLTEFVAKLGHLVETVDELSKMAKFSQYAINPI